MEKARTRMRVYLNEIKIGGTELTEEIKGSLLSLRVSLNEVRMHFNLTSDPYKLASAQNIARNLNIHNLLIEALVGSPLWDDNKRSGKRVVKQDGKQLFLDVIDTLFNFCYENPINQKIIFANIGLFSQLVGNNIGVMRLLKEASKS
jgi:hypothetical protein